MPDHHLELPQRVLLLHEQRARPNELRFAAGKPALGFLNPLFYQNPAAFNDVTSGVNCGTGGCGKGHGFPAVAGWDPATGLGTPNYAALAKIVA